jgi:hypothetical protein
MFCPMRVNATKEHRTSSRVGKSSFRLILVAQYLIVLWSLRVQRILQSAILTLWLGTTAARTQHIECQHPHLAPAG